MPFANDPTDPANRNPQERLAEVAAVFAEGFLRLRRRAAVPDADTAVIHRIEYGEFAGNGLEVLLKRGFINNVVNAAGEAENGDLR